jgi:hypothetical protein
VYLQAKIFPDFAGLAEQLPDPFINLSLNLFPSKTLYEIKGTAPAFGKKIGSGKVPDFVQGLYFHRLPPRMAYYTPGGGTPNVMAHFF